MILVDMLRKLGLGVNGLYLCAWVIALAGLAVIQDWCKDHSEEPMNIYTLLAHRIGDDCKSLYRFPWFIWCLSALPVLLSVVHLVKPGIVRGGSSALFAVLAVLQMLATDTFHNMAKSNLAGRSDDYKKGAYLGVVGFGLLSALSLLIILLESLLGHKEPERHVDAGGKLPDAQQPAVQV